MLPKELAAKSVMIVDDMQSMRAIVAALLRSMGFTNVVQAEDGERALKKLRLTPVDIILSDWDMPVMDGLTLLKEVRAMEECKNTAFFLITANNAQEKVAAAREAGVTDYIVKPITFQLVKERIEKAFGVAPLPSSGSIDFNKIR
jgi:two-component system, chemotaxis family, chemotaxis protein CheY